MLAITTRFHNDWTQEYIDELERQHPNLQIRIISNQSSVEDFCFLKSTKRQLVGHDLSSFFQWAAYLGVHDDADANENERGGGGGGGGGGIASVRSYAMKQKKKKNNNKNNDDEDMTNNDHDPNWNHQILKERFHYETYYYYESF